MLDATKNIHDSREEIDIIRSFSSVTLLCLTLCNRMDYSTSGFPIHHQLPELAQTPVHLMPSNCLTSVIPFSSCPQSFPASGSFPLSQFFPSGVQSIGASVSVSASVLSVYIQDWFPLGLTGLISLQSKELSRVFPNTTTQKHRFFSVQLSLCFNSYIYTWLLEKS